MRFPTLPYYLCTLSHIRTRGTYLIVIMFSIGYLLVFYPHSTRHWYVNIRGFFEKYLPKNVYPDFRPKVTTFDRVSDPSPLLIGQLLLKRTKVNCRRSLSRPPPARGYKWRIAKPTDPRDRLIEIWDYDSHRAKTWRVGQTLISVLDSARRTTLEKNNLTLTSGPPPPIFCRPV